MGVPGVPPWYLCLVLGHRSTGSPVTSIKYIHDSQKGELYRDNTTVAAIGPFFNKQNMLEIMRYWAAGRGIDSRLKRGRKICSVNEQPFYCRPTRT